MPSVRLLVPDLATLDAALAGDAKLAAALGHEVAAGWNGYPQALGHTRDAVAADPATVRWGARLFIAGDPGVLVGWGGFKGLPRDGAVEIGYEVAPRWRGRGIATSAARALIDEALAVPEVDSVIAHTLAEPGPSVRILEKLGFTLVGEVAERQVGTAWRHRLSR